MTNEPKKVDACPICGGEIQIHQTEYCSGATLEFHSKSGHLDMVETGRWEMSGDTVIYCENDHTEDAMIAAITSLDEKEEAEDVLGSFDENGDAIEEATK